MALPRGAPMTRVVRCFTLAVLGLAACAGSEAPAGVEAGADAASAMPCDPAVARGATDCAAVERCKAAGGICTSDASAPFLCLRATTPAIACESRVFTSSCCVPAPCHAAGGLCLPRCFGDGGATAVIDAGCGTPGDVCCAGQL
jgi:hypothetical protein